jgi:hypothetical protein
MIHALAEQDRRERVNLLASIAVISVLLWQTQLGMLVLYPFTILATWFHEMGHGIAAMALGGRFERLLIYPDGSGMALSQTPIDLSRTGAALIAAGGPLGPALAGGALIVASRSHRATRAALTTLGIVLLASALIWVRSPIGWVVLPALGGFILYTARWAGDAERRFTIQLLGIQACISVWGQFTYLFSPGGVIDGRLHRSDTGVIADVTPLPYWAWGAIISSATVAMIIWSLRIALRR